MSETPTENKRDDYSLILGLLGMILTWVMSAAPPFLHATTGKRLADLPGGTLALAVVAVGSAYLLIRFTFAWRSWRKLAVFPFVALWAVGAYLVIREIPAIPDPLTIILPAALFVAGCALSLWRPGGAGTELVESGTLAAQYVRAHHAGRSLPFTRREESELIEAVSRRFGLREETAAQIIEDNWPEHREWLPEG